MGLELRTANGMSHKADSSLPGAFADLRSIERRRHRAIWLLRIGIVVVILAAWQLVASLKLVDPSFTGEPSEIAGRVVQLYRVPNLGLDLLTTLSETLFGFVIGSVVGFGFGFATAQFQVLERATAPLFDSLNSMPRIAFAPLFIIWFGLGQDSKIALSVLLVFFIVAANTRAALIGADRDLLLLARSLGASEVQRLVMFVLPAGLPTIMSGLELGLAFSFLGAVAGEILGGYHGLGVLLATDANTFRTNQFFAVLIVLGVVALLCINVVRRVGGYFTRWEKIEMAEEVGP